MDYASARLRVSLMYDIRIYRLKADVKWYDNLEGDVPDTYPAHTELLKVCHQRQSMLNVLAKLEKHGKNTELDWLHEYFLNSECRTVDYKTYYYIFFGKVVC